jgi:hypothetical protein
VPKTLLCDIIIAVHFFLNFFHWVPGDARRKRTSWRGWRKRRDGLARNYRVLG